MSSNIQQDDTGYYDNNSMHCIMDDYCYRIRQALCSKPACAEADTHSEDSKNVGIFTLALLKILARNSANRARKRLKHRFVINPRNRCKVRVNAVITPEIVNAKKSNLALV